MAHKNSVKKMIEKLAHREKIPAFDLTGPPIFFMMKHLQAKRVYRDYDWQAIDVSDSAIEETAAVVMKKITAVSG